MSWFRPRCFQSCSPLNSLFCPMFFVDYCECLDRLWVCVPVSVISVFSLLNVSKKFRVSSFRVPGSSVQPHLDAIVTIVLHCIVLYCVVLHCLLLYCIVLYCIVLCFVALHCIVLYCIVLYCIVLYCVVLHCIVLYWVVLLYNTLECFSHQPTRHCIRAGKSSGCWN